MTDPTWLADRFEAERPRLRAVAYRLLGSSAEAENAVQDAWLRLSRSDAAAIENLAAVAPARQRQLVDAFLAAARGGDFEGLVRILDPDAVVRADFGAGGPFGVADAPTEFRGAAALANSALSFRRLAPGARHATVNGAPGFVAFNNDQPFAVLAFASRHDRIVEIDVIGDPERLAALGLRQAPGGHVR